MLSQFFKSVRYNQLFTPFALIITFSTGYYFVGLNFIEKTYGYSYFIAIAAILLIFKTLVLAFGEIEQNKNLFKWFLVGIQLTLTTVSVYLSFLSINWLITQDTFLQTSIFYLLLAELIYAAQIFFAKIKGFLLVTISSVVVYFGCYLALYFKLFSYTEKFVLMQQAVGVLCVIVELVGFFAILRLYVDHKQSKESDKE